MGESRVIDEIRRKVAALPFEGPPAVQQIRRAAVQAVETITLAVTIDPTLPEYDRERRAFDLLDELLRQAKPLGRQVVVEMERWRLVEEGADEREIARLGRTNKVAPYELAALSRRCTKIAADIRAAALPDWNTPQRIRERSEALLPPDYVLEEIADRLRSAVKASLALSHPAPEAVRLAALADEIVRS